MNILFTSVGRRVELLRSFQRAFQSLSLAGKIVAVDVDPLAPALQLADQPYLVPRLDASDYLTVLTDICQRERIDLIFPLIDPDILELARYREALTATGARLAVVSPEAARLTADKWMTCHFFESLGLSVPRSWLPGEVEPSPADYPLFIKPRQGSASAQTFRVRNARELNFFADFVSNPLIQEYLPGPEITSDVICDLDGSVLAVISRQRLEVRWGEVAKGVTIYDPTICAACIKIAQALPAVGPITVQCLLRDGVPHFTEINARLGGGAPLGIAAGADWPQWLLARVAGLPVDIPPPGSYRTGLYMTRFDDAFFLTPKSYENMASHRL